MVQPSAETTAITTFIVRLWREWSGGEARWRGRIEHAQSGRRADFLAVDQMLAFLQQMGVTIAAHAGTGITTEDKKSPLMLVFDSLSPH